MSHHESPLNPYKDYASGGIALSGFLLIGIGAGFFYKPVWLGLIIGTLIGLGVGLVALGIISRDRY